MPGKKTAHTNQRGKNTVPSGRRGPCARALAAIRHVVYCRPCRGGRTQALNQTILAAVSGAKGVSHRLLVLDIQADPGDVVFKSALKTVAVVRYDSKKHTLKEIAGLVYEAHKQNKAPFMSIAIGNAGPCLDMNSADYNMWRWGKDLQVNLNKIDEAMDQLAPLFRYLCSALQKTHMGHAHIDFLACGLASACKGLIPALEEFYGVDFRGSSDDAGQLSNRGNWTMETDGDYDAGLDYIDWARIKTYVAAAGGGGPEKRVSGVV